MTTPTATTPAPTRRKTTAFIALTAALAAAVALTPTAAAYVFPPIPAAQTLMVERLASHVPTTDAATVLIKTKTGLGTGFNVGNGRIVTAAHVVKGSDTVTIKTYDGRVATAKVVAFDEAQDLAVLVTILHMLSAEMDCTIANVGDPIMAIGNPMGQEFVSSFGRIAGAPRELRASKDVLVARSVYITDMTTVMGQSGGPVFHEGRVIGVVSAVMLAPLELPGQDKDAEKKIYTSTVIGFGFVVPSAGVCKMLADLPAEGEGV
ncbi:MAG: trypsin-like peptidase domain-containing protein [Rhizobium sp.]|nr:trypsin-like peptidase domain-containing protein [Rhizobium sp.]